MEIQLMIPSPAITTTSPYATAPSTPPHPHFPNFYYSTPTTPLHTTFQNDDDFAFDFSGHLQPPSISDAEDLFHCGKIKTLNLNSFTATFHQTTGEQTNRGRETTTNSSTTRGKLSRSSSPFRISDILLQQDTDHNNSPPWYNKWNLKNLLLFRTTSEGSARKTKEKDPVNRYSRIRSSSFRSMESGVGRKVSAHEMHYTANRAVAAEMRRRTYLPYKSGWLGCLGFYNNSGAGGGYEVSRRISYGMKLRGV